MDQNKKLTKENIILKAHELKGRLLKEFINNDTRNKGVVGDVAEEWFGIPKNNEKSPDFKRFGVDMELKTLPIKKIRNNLYSAKERMSLTMINYMEDFKSDTLEESALFSKLRQILVITYFSNIENPCFDDSWVLSVTDNEMAILKEDYNIIIGKIRKGLAHTLSDSDTTFLSASRKGWKESLVKQPFSDNKAKRRVWALKTTLITRVIRRHYNMAFSKHILSKNTLLKKMIEITNPLIGMTPNEIFKSIGKNSQISKSKHSNAMKAIIKGASLNTQMFDEVMMKVKTMKLNKKGQLQESMSFSQINFKELNDTVFEETDVYQYMRNGILLNIFDNNWKYLGIKKISFDRQKIMVAKMTFERVKQSYKDNEIWLPKYSDNLFLHIRPKDVKKNKNINNKLPDNLAYKQCWWINKNELRV